MPDATFNFASPAEPSDEALARAAASGDEGAFESLVRRYQVPLLRFLARRGSRVTQEEEDLLQETLLRMHRARGQYSERWSYRTWAFTIARRVAIDASRRRANVPTMRIVDEADASEPAREVHEPGDDRLWRLARRVLSGDQVRALWLFHVEEMPAREIAAVLGRSWVSIKTMLHRARHQLRQAAETEGILLEGRTPEHRPVETSTR